MTLPGDNVRDTDSSGRWFETCHALRCAEGYMGQRCEFKDLDGSYLPAREKVLLETASIAGGATVACVLVFVVLFAVYIFMQKDKDKRCRQLKEEVSQVLEGCRLHIKNSCDKLFMRSFYEQWWEQHLKSTSSSHQTVWLPLENCLLSPVLPVVVRCSFLSIQKTEIKEI
ncbi:hypothetical protein SK128_014183, partial [Halocaridina rubra]